MILMIYEMISVNFRYDNYFRSALIFLIGKILFNYILRRSLPSLVLWITNFFIPKNTISDIEEIENRKSKTPLDSDPAEYLLT